MPSRNAPNGYCCHKTDIYAVYYNLLFLENSIFRSIRKAIKVDQNLHVKFQLCGNLNYSHYGLSQKKIVHLPDTAYLTKDVSIIHLI